MKKTKQKHESENKKIAGEQRNHNNLCNDTLHCITTNELEAVASELMKMSIEVSSKSFYFFILPANLPSPISFDNAHNNTLFLPVSGNHRVFFRDGFFNTNSDSLGKASGK
jgi:hypothetical protein